MRYREWIVLIGLAASGSPTLAADAQRGRLLYETNCGGCHYQKIHERKTTSIRSHAALRTEIAKWARQANRTLAPAELDDIAEYLDRSHYKLAK